MPKRCKLHNILDCFVCKHIVTADDIIRQVEKDTKDLKPVKNNKSNDSKDSS